jgi:hypothetical protein
LIHFGLRRCDHSGPNGQKFFGSFFQERTAFLPVLPNPTARLQPLEVQCLMRGM